MLSVGHFRRLPTPPEALVARPLPEGHNNYIMTKYSYPEDRGVYADILFDKWFKRAFKEFGDAKRLMLLFLQALIPEREIVSIEYASEESTNQNPDGKNIRVDVECVGADGQRFVVEVQQAEQRYFYDRAVFNSTFAIQRQLKEGWDTYRFKPVYFIGIMRFSLHDGDERFLYRYSISEETSGELMTDDLHYIFLEVPKCRLTKNASLIEKFGYALDRLPSLDSKPASLEGEIFDLLFSSANLSNFTTEDKIKYHNDMTTERDIRNQIAFAREEGAAQRNAEIARAMLAKGIDSMIVQECTGLTAEEVAALKSSLS